MSDMKMLVSVVTDNGCLWPSEAYPARLGPGTSENYRSQALYRGLCAVGKQLERDLTLRPQRALSASSCWLLPFLFIFWETDEGKHAAVFLWQR